FVDGIGKVAKVSAPLLALGLIFAAGCRGLVDPGNFMPVQPTSEGLSALTSGEALEPVIRIEPTPPAGAPVVAAPPAPVPGARAAVPAPEGLFEFDSIRGKRGRTFSNYHQNVYVLRTLKRRNMRYLFWPRLKTAGYTYFYMDGKNEVVVSPTDPDLFERATHVRGSSSTVYEIHRPETFLGGKRTTRIAPVALVILDASGTRVIEQADELPDVARLLRSGYRFLSGGNSIFSDKVIGFARARRYDHAATQILIERAERARREVMATPQKSPADIVRLAITSKRITTQWYGYMGKVAGTSETSTGDASVSVGGGVGARDGLPGYGLTVARTFDPTMPARVRQGLAWIDRGAYMFRDTQVELAIQALMVYGSWQESAREEARLCAALLSEMSELGITLDAALMEGLTGRNREIDFRGIEGAFQVHGAGLGVEECMRKLSDISIERGVQNRMLGKFSMLVDVDREALEGLVDRDIDLNEIFDVLEAHGIERGILHSLLAEEADVRGAEAKKGEAKGGLRKRFGIRIGFPFIIMPVFSVQRSTNLTTSMANLMYEIERLEGSSALGEALDKRLIYEYLLDQIRDCKAEIERAVTDLEGELNSKRDEARRSPEASERYYQVRLDLDWARAVQRGVTEELNNMIREYELKVSNAGAPLSVAVGPAPAGPPLTAEIALDAALAHSRGTGRIRRAQLDLNRKRQALRDLPRTRIGLPGAGVSAEYRGHEGAVSSTGVGISLPVRIDTRLGTRKAIARLDIEVAERVVRLLPQAERERIANTCNRYSAAQEELRISQERFDTCERLQSSLRTLEARGQLSVARASLAQAKINIARARGELIRLLKMNPATMNIGDLAGAGLDEVIGGLQSDAQLRIEILERKVEQAGLILRLHDRWADGFALNLGYSFTHLESDRMDAELRNFVVTVSDDLLKSLLGLRGKNAERRVLQARAEELQRKWQRMLETERARAESVNGAYAGLNDELRTLMDERGLLVFERAEKRGELAEFDRRFTEDARPGLNPEDKLWILIRISDIDRRISQIDNRVRTIRINLQRIGTPAAAAASSKAARFLEMMDCDEMTHFLEQFVYGQVELPGQPLYWHDVNQDLQSVSDALGYEVGFVAAFMNDIDEAWDRFETYFQLNGTTGDYELRPEYMISTPFGDLPNPDYAEDITEAQQGIGVEVPLKEEIIREAEESNIIYSWNFLGLTIYDPYDGHTLKVRRELRQLEGIEDIQPRLSENVRVRTQQYVYALTTAYNAQDEDTIRELESEIEKVRRSLEYEVIRAQELTTRVEALEGLRDRLRAQVERRKDALRRVAPVIASGAGVDPAVLRSEGLTPAQFEEVWRRIEENDPEIKRLRIWKDVARHQTGRPRGWARLLPRVDWGITGVYYGPADTMTENLDGMQDYAFDLYAGLSWELANAKAGMQDFRRWLKEREATEAWEDTRGDIRRDLEASISEMEIAANRVMLENSMLKILRARLAGTDIGSMNTARIDRLMRRIEIARRRYQEAIVNFHSIRVRLEEYGKLLGFDIFEAARAAAPTVAVAPAAPAAAPDTAAADKRRELEMAAGAEYIPSGEIDATEIPADLVNETITALGVSDDDLRMLADYIDLPGAVQEGKAEFARMLAARMNMQGLTDAEIAAHLEGMARWAGVVRASGLDQSNIPQFFARFI
ncbi:MAG: TolC family protein, partial [Candidatus Omnitrophota bacterium]